MMDAAPAMEAMSAEDLRRETEARIAPSFHFAARGSREKDEAGSPDEEGVEEPRLSSFNEVEFGGSWSELSKDSKRRLRNMASFRQEENSEEATPFLRGSRQTDEELDDDFLFLEGSAEKDAFPTEIYEKKSWWRKLFWPDSKTNDTEEKKEKELDNGEEEAPGEEDDTSENLTDGIATVTSPPRDDAFIPPSLRRYESGRSNSDIEDESTTKDDLGTGPLLNNIHAHLLNLLPQGVDLNDFTPSQRAFLMSALELEQGDEVQKKTLRLLEHMYDRILRGKLTRKQILVAGLGGLAIATGVRSAITLLFSEDAYKIISNSTPLDNKDVLLFFNSFIYYYVQWVFFIDTACRNVKTLAQFAAPSTSEFEYEKGKTNKILMQAADISFYVASSLVGLLFCYSLFKVMFTKNPFIISEGPSFDHMITFGFTALALLTDDILYFGSRLSTSFRAFVNHNFIKKKKHNKNLQAESYRCKILKKLENIEKLISHISGNSINKTLEDISRIFFVFYRSTDHPPLPLKAAEVLRTLKELRSFHVSCLSELPLPTASKAGSKIAKLIIEDALPLVATWGRSVAFWYVIYQTFEAIEVENEIVKMVSSIILGGIIASLTQLTFEIQGIQHLFHKIREERQIITIGLTLHDYLAGLWATTPYLAIGAFATKAWSLGTRLACLIPAGITGYLSNGMTFQQSDEDLRDFVKSLNLISNSDIVYSKKKELLNIVQEYKVTFENLHPLLVLKLKEILTQGSIEELDFENEKPSARNLKFLPLTQQFLALFSHFVIFEKSLDERELKTRKFLLYAQGLLDPDKITFKQTLLGGSIGIISGLMSPYMIFYYWMFKVFPESFLQSIILNDNFSSKKCFYNTYISQFWALDGISRNVSRISKVLASSMSDFECKQGNQKRAWEKSMGILFYVGGGITSLLPVYYYLISLLEFDSENGYIEFIKVGYTATGLFLNTLFFYGPKLTHYVDRVFDYFTTVPPSPTEDIRRRFLKEFKDLKWWFGRLKDDVVNEVHQQVLSQAFLDQATTQEELEKYKMAEALKTLWALRQIHNQHEDEMFGPEPEPWRKGFSKAVGRGLPLLATYGRSYIYWTVFYTLLGVIGITDETTKITFSVAAALIASLVQGSAEVEGTCKGVYDLTFGKKIGEDTSQGGARITFRRLGKFQNYIAAAFETIPYLAVGITSTTDWSLWLRLVTLIPAGLADFFKNVLKFNQSIGETALFVDRVAAKVSYPTVTQKRNQLVALTRRYRKMFKKLHPDILMKLDEILVSVEEGKGGNQDFSRDEFSENGDEMSDEEDGSAPGPSVEPFEEEISVNFSTEDRITVEEDNFNDGKDLKEKEKDKKKVSQYPSRSNTSKKKGKKKKARTNNRSGELEDLTLSRDRGGEGWTSYTK